jgi:hypothetical protein
VGGCRNDELRFNFTCFLFHSRLDGDGSGFFRRVFPGVVSTTHGSRDTKTEQPLLLALVMDALKENCHLAVGRSISHSLQDVKSNFTP